MISRIFTTAECAPNLCPAIMNEILTTNVNLYASRHQVELGEALGSGKDGIVLVAKSKFLLANVAIKVHRFAELYQREKTTYERLQMLGIATICEFNVPELIGVDDDLRIIEMTVVVRPFVLDFAAAYLDVRPQFPDEVWAEWEADKREQFEERWRKVREILDAFEAFGIYLMDLSREYRVRNLTRQACGLRTRLSTQACAHAVSRLVSSQAVAENQPSKTA